jgi:hypothetical protein
MTRRTLSGNPVRFAQADKAPRVVRFPVRYVSGSRERACPVRCPVREPDGHTHTKGVSCPVWASGWPTLESGFFLLHRRVTPGEVIYFPEHAKGM